jgi:hypothetical protein
MVQNMDTGFPPRDARAIQPDEPSRSSKPGNVILWSSIPSAAPAASFPPQRLASRALEGYLALDALMAACRRPIGSARLSMDGLNRARAMIAADPAKRHSLDTLEELAKLDRWT